MPGYDRTGPAGAGPMTGWGRGRCRGAAPDAMGPVGRGFGRGGGFGRRGGGRGWGWRAGWTASPAAGYPVPAEAPAETDAGEASALRAALADIQRRLAALEKSGA